MGVYIKGFEKPDHCLRCPVKGIDDECLLQSEAANADYESWEDQMANCPLVPVPPHSRMIDADALMELYADTDDLRLKDMKVPIAVIRQNIMDMPTIIPAEEEREG